MSKHISDVSTVVLPPQLSASDHKRELHYNFQGLCDVCKYHWYKYNYTAVQSNVVYAVSPSCGYMEVQAQVGAVCTKGEVRHQSMPDATYMPLSLRMFYQLPQKVYTNVV